MGSERKEDEWIMQNVLLPEHGFYVDLGCAWPVQFSNTEFLRKRGWRGLCVDGNPIYAPLWQGVETFVCTVLGDGKPVQFETGGAPDLSRVGSGTVVPTIKLCDLLWNIPAIDFISCDLEGQEFAALSTLHWEKHRPKCIIAEYSTAGLGEDWRVRELLVKEGYKVVHANVSNFIYVPE